GVPLKQESVLEYKFFPLKTTWESALSKSRLSFILTRNSEQKGTNRLCRGSMCQYTTAVRVSYVIPEHRIHGIKILREKGQIMKPTEGGKTTQHVSTFNNRLGLLVARA